MVGRNTSVNQARKGKKRWYLDASSGIGGPLIGGVSVKAGSGTISKRAIKTIVKKELVKDSETKFSNQNENFATRIQSQVYTYAPLQTYPLPGSTYYQRIGSDIYLRNLVLKFNFQNSGVNAASPGPFPIVRFRIMAFWADSQLVVTPGTGGVFGSGVGTSQLFFGSTVGTANALINNKLDHVMILDKTIVVKADYAGELKSSIQTISLKLNKKVTFHNDTAPMFLKDKQLYVVVIPYAVGGTDAISVVGGFCCDMMITYKDIN